MMNIAYACILVIYGGIFINAANAGETVTRSTNLPLPPDAPPAAHSSAPIASPETTVSDPTNKEIKTKNDLETYIRRNQKDRRNGNGSRLSLRIRRYLAPGEIKSKFVEKTLNIDPDGCTYDDHQKRLNLFKFPPLETRFEISTMRDGVEIDYAVVKPPNCDDQSVLKILFFGSIYPKSDISLVQQLVKNGSAIYYKFCRPSIDFLRSIHKMNDDAEDFFLQLHNSGVFKDQHIHVYGRSHGIYAAVHVAHANHDRIKTIVLENPYPSIVEAISIGTMRCYKDEYIRTLVPHQCDVLEKLRILDKNTPLYVPIGLVFTNCGNKVSSHIFDQNLPNATRIGSHTVCADPMKVTRFMHETNPHNKKAKEEKIAETPKKECSDAADEENRGIKKTEQEKIAETPKKECLDDADEEDAAVVNADTLLDDIDEEILTRRKANETNKTDDNNTNKEINNDNATAPMVSGKGHKRNDSAAIGLQTMQTTGGCSGEEKNDKNERHSGFHGGDNHSHHYHDDRHHHRDDSHHHHEDRHHHHEDRHHHHEDRHHHHDDHHHDSHNYDGGCGDS